MSFTIDLVAFFVCGLVTMEIVKVIDDIKPNSDKNKCNPHG